MSEAEDGQGTKRIKVSWLIWLLVLVVLVAGLWLAWQWLFPRPPQPVVLSPQEAQQLEHKVAALRPQRYHEEPAMRELRFTEREINALLTADPTWSGRVAVHLDQDLASATILFPIHKDFPLLGGTTLRIDTGFELRYADSRPVVILHGVSLWGIPIPNRWLGDLKHIDLVTLYGREAGVWQALADGVEAIEIGRGELLIRLEE